MSHLDTVKRTVILARTTHHRLRELSEQLGMSGNAVVGACIGVTYAVLTLAQAGIVLQVDQVDIHESELVAGAASELEQIVDRAFRKLGHPDVN